MASETAILTLIPRQSGRYAAFPTVCLHDEQLHLFYRLGHCGAQRTHGHGGEILTTQLSVSEFLHAMAQPCALPDLQGRARQLFAEGNEMDAIVTDFGDCRFSLATRTFREGMEGMATWLSLGSRPSFATRARVQVDGVSWLVFYGHGLCFEGRQLLPAYGGLLGDGPLMRPLLLELNPEGELALFSALDQADAELMFNESSLQWYRGQWWMFMRRHRKPHGIWLSRSPDLRHWEPAQLLVEAAQAPMARVHDGRLWLAYRQLLGEEEAALALRDVDSGRSWTLDRYEGCVYDGGYADLVALEGALYAVYYHGNREGEPSIRACGPLAHGRSNAFGA